MNEVNGPTFISPQTIIDQHKSGNIDVRQAVVALARRVIALESEMQKVRRPK